MNEKSKNIGLGIEAPPKNGDDKHCPFYGDVKLRGRNFVATVVAAKVAKTATVQRERLHYIPKYERYTKRMSKLRVHNPLCISAKEGDRVRVYECRPISKTKRFVIVEKLSLENGSSKDETN
jgi:small subunit ribosomal protein S17